MFGRVVRPHQCRVSFPSNSASAANQSSTSLRRQARSWLTNTNGEIKNCVSKPARLTCRALQHWRLFRAHRKCRATMHFDDRFEETVSMTACCRDRRRSLHSIIHPVQPLIDARQYRHAQCDYFDFPCSRFLSPRMKIPDCRQT